MVFTVLYFVVDYAVFNFDNDFEEETKLLFI